VTVDTICTLESVIDGDILVIVISASARVR